jgi:DNA (cytosine-5)-methyltransferase 1
MAMTLNHVDLFSGIGGFSLAARWAGFRTVLHCERDPYCQKVLAKHWPEVPIAPDVYTLTGAIVREHLAATYAPDVPGGAGEGLEGVERTLLQGTGVRPTDSGQIDLLTGGFPCQPFSVAEKQRGAADDRHVWPQMLRVIEEVRPRFVCGENVAGFVRMALDDVLADLEAAGYETGAVVLPACGVGAWHRRERVFILAHDVSDAQHPERRAHDARHGGASGEYLLPTERREGDGASGSGGADVPDAADGGLRRRRASGDTGQPAFGGAWLDWDGRAALESIWESEPAVGRVAHGIPGRVDRLRALGNAVVPFQVAPILAAIAEVMA